MYCKNCGKQIGDESKFCPYCGEAFIKTKKKFPMIKLMLIISMLVVITAVSAVAFKFLPRKSKNNELIAYVKDSSLYEYNVKTNEKIKIYDNWAADQSSLYYGLRLWTTKHTDDEKGMLYIKYIDDDSEGGDLIYKSLKGKKADEIGIDSGVGYFSLLDNDNVIYVKEDGYIYNYNVKKNDKQLLGLAEKVVGIDMDSKTVLYLEKENILYTLHIGEEIEMNKIDINVKDVHSVFGDLNNLYYSKGDALYQCKNLNEIVKIADDAEFFSSYQKNGIYYKKKGDISQWTYNDFLSLDKMFQALNISDVNTKKEFEEQLRRNFENTMYRVYELYAYDGNESKMITKNALEIGENLFLELDNLSPKKMIDFSETMTTTEAESIFSFIGKNYLFSGEYRILFLGLDFYVDSTIDGDLLDSESLVDLNNNTIYFAAKEKDIYSELWKYDMLKDSISENMIDNQIQSAEEFRIVNGTYLNQTFGLIYLKIFNDLKSTICIDGKSFPLDFKASLVNIRFDENSKNTVIELTADDQDNDKLYIYDGTNLELLGNGSDFSYAGLSKDSGAFISYNNFDIDENGNHIPKGDLFTTINGKKEKVDSDVRLVYAVYDKILDLALLSNY